MTGSAKQSRTAKEDGLLRPLRSSQRRSHSKDHPMQYRNLGRSGLKISPICLGTMMFGGPTDEATSMRIVTKAREAGVNFIDTADAYNGGTSDQVVGRALSNNGARLGIARPVASQPYYNAMNRMPEVEHFPACHFYGLGIVPYSPLARGVLTGKYRPDAAPDKETRAGRNDKRMMQTEWRPESLKLAQEIRQHAEAKGITAGQFAGSLVLNSSFVSAGIAGPRTQAHWDDYLRPLDYRFTAEDEALIDRLVASGHPSTPGYNDPAYPIEGRRARTAACKEN